MRFEFPFSPVLFETLEKIELCLEEELREMTEAEAKLIDAVLACHPSDLTILKLNTFAARVEMERSAHPYGAIAESMLTEPRKTLSQYSGAQAAGL